jgi:hypothetical protein
VQIKNPQKALSGVVPATGASSSKEVGRKEKVGEADGCPDEDGCAETVGPTVGDFNEVGLDDTLGCTETVGDMDGRPDEDGFDDRLGDVLGRTDVVGFDDRLGETLGRTDVGACVVGAYKLWDMLGCTMLSTFNDFDAFPDFDDLPNFDDVLLVFDAFPDLDPRESVEARLPSSWERIRLRLSDWRIGLKRGDDETLDCLSEGALPAKDLSWKLRLFSAPLRPSHMAENITINTTVSNRRRSAASLNLDVGIIFLEV